MQFSSCTGELWPHLGVGQQKRYEMVASSEGNWQADPVSFCRWGGEKVALPREIKKSDMIYDVLCGAATANSMSHTSGAEAPPPTSRAATAHPRKRAVALTPKAITTWHDPSEVHLYHLCIESPDLGDSGEPRTRKRRKPMKTIQTYIKRLSNSLCDAILSGRLSHSQCGRDPMDCTPKCN